jgi:hypothetical protein
MDASYLGMFNGEELRKEYLVKINKNRYIKRIKEFLFNKYMCLNIEDI